MPSKPKQPAPDPHFKFPKNFFWGAATSAHQVEGGQTNNWTEWEREHAAELAHGSEKAFDNESVHWYRLKDQAQDPQNYISGSAVDHYHRYEADFKLAHELHHNMHRFSIEWSRIETQPGVYDAAAIEHYRQVIHSLRAKHIEPMVTLFHFTLPTWVEAQGGWHNPATLKDWRRYVTTVVEALGADVTYWCTINEPEVFTTFSYMFGFWPPQEKSLLKSIQTYYSILPRAHIAAYRVIKRHNPQAQVGIAKNNMHYVALGRIISRLNMRFSIWWGNHLFLDQIKQYQDYIGVNYYMQFNIKGLRGDIDQQNPSEMGWGLHPEGLAAVIKDLHSRFRKPMIITECGLADSTDEMRAWYIKEILRAVHGAMTEGVVVKGFLYWSLLDNFEWDKGFWPEFGLIAVDRKSMRRTVRQSAREYAEIIQAGGLD